MPRVVTPTAVVKRPQLQVLSTPIETFGLECSFCHAYPGTVRGFIASRAHRLICADCFHDATETLQKLCEAQYALDWQTRPREWAPIETLLRSFSQGELCVAIAMARLHKIQQLLDSAAQAPEGAQCCFCGAKPQPGRSLVGLHDGAEHSIDAYLCTDCLNASAHAVEAANWAEGDRWPDPAAIQNAAVTEALFGLFYRAAPNLLTESEQILVRALARAITANARQQVMPGLAMPFDRELVVRLQMV